MFLLSTSPPASAGKTVVKDMFEVFSVGPRPTMTPAGPETTIRHQVFFSDLEGSTSDWGVIDFRAGQTNAWNIVSGARSCVGNAWWCGQTGLPNGDGYGNNWAQMLQTNVPINLTGSTNNVLTFNYRMRSEYWFDWGWVMIHDGSPSSTWDTLASYSGDFGTGCNSASIAIPNSWTTRPQPIKLLFAFGSDLTVSAADSTDAFTGWSLDDVRVTAQGGVIKFADDMETGPAKWTAWAANPPANWHIESQPETSPPGGCFFLFTNVWVPFQGSVSGVVPDFTDAMLTTPVMDLSGVFVGTATTLRLQFDEWIDLPYDKGIYWSLWIQGSDDKVTWTPWRNALDPWVFSGPPPQCIENAFKVFDPYATNLTGIQPGTRWIRLGLRIRDEKAVSPDGQMLQLGHTTEGIYFDNIGVYYVYTISGVETVSGAPADARASLRKIFPNPFNPTTTVEFSVPSPGPASVRIYDVRGRLAATLVNETMAAGVYRVRWNGKTGDGRELPTGVYFARLESPKGRDSARLMMLK